MDYIENDVKNNPYRLKSWLQYLAYLDGSNEYERYKVYERALFHLPRSYKLWYAYLDERERNLRSFSINNNGYKCLTESFERALTHLHKMPKLWQKYCNLLMKLCKGTSTRHAFDRALQSLPITQHQGIWDLYIKWIAQFDCSETAIRVYRRYLMFDPTQREIFINYLDGIGMYQEEVKQLILCLDDNHYISPLGSTKHQLWMKLCDICAHHGDEVSTILDVEAIIKCGINQFSDEVGRLWTKLSDFYIQQGLFNKARDVYEEAFNHVVTVKDFTIVFDKYIKVEENILTAKMQWLEELQSQIDDEKQQQKQQQKLLETTTTATTKSAKSNKASKSLSSSSTAVAAAVNSAVVTSSVLLTEQEDEKKELENEIEIRLSRIEYMLLKRPLLLNSVVLRQNPHNVYEWLKRIKILRQQSNNSMNSMSNNNNNNNTNSNSNSNNNNTKESNEQDEESEQNIENKLMKELIAQTYADAIKTIDPKLAVGKLSHIYIGFSNFFQRQLDYDSARSIFKKATMIEFKSVEELLNVWCAWAEMEMKLECYDNVLSLLQKAVSKPTVTANNSTVTNIDKNNKMNIQNNRSNQLVLSSSDALVNNNDEYDKDTPYNTTSSSTSFKTQPKSSSLALVHKSVKIWNLYLDIEENLGTVDTCRAAYERAIDLKITTPQMMLNYASYLEEKKYFDDSFRVYEKATTLFVYPQLHIIWLTYIDKFVARYGGTKIERLRDMFENALTNLPEEYVPELYIKYAKVEEEMGLGRHAISIYDRASRAVSQIDKLKMYQLYAKKMEQFYGITKTRAVYERAVAELSDNDCREICTEFAEMETKLGEVDRARALYQYGSQFAVPAHEPEYWMKWKQFEEAHGNEDSYREMLRVKRSVDTFNSQNPMYVGANKRSAATATADDSSAGTTTAAVTVAFEPEKKRQATAAM